MQRRGCKRARFDPLRARRASTCRLSLRGELADQVGNQSGPTGLVRSAAAAAVVAVKVLVEEDIILEIGIGLKLFIGPENRTSAVGAAEKELDEAVAQLIGDLVEGEHDA